MFRTRSRNRSPRRMSWIFLIIIVPGLVGLACALPGGTDSTTDPNGSVTSEESGAESVLSNRTDQDSSPDTSDEASSATVVEAPTDTPSSAEPTPTATLVMQPTSTTGQETAAAPTETPVVVDETLPEGTGTTVATSQNINTAFILDASGSMVADLGGQARLQIAQDAVGSLSAGLPASINASLWVYGHRAEQDNQAESCQDIEQVIALGPVDAQQFDTVAHSFEAKGYTPITDALRQAASRLPADPNERNTVVLVSDGEETCGGDPCALAAELAASEIKLEIHTIGLAVDDVTRAQLQCIAENSGGTYTDADSAEGLGLALEGAAEAAADDTFSIVEGLGRPTVVVVSPDGQNVYVAGFDDDSLAVFTRDAISGSPPLECWWLD